MKMNRNTSILMLTLGISVLLVAIGCGGQGDQVADASSDPEAVRVEEEDLPEPPPPQTASTATRQTPRQVPEEREKRVSPPSTMTVTIPEGTTLAISFVDLITSETAMVGDPVVTTLRQPVIAGDRVIFPVDSRVEGRVTDVKPATKGFKDTSGAVAVSFDRISSPSGRQATIVAGFTKIAEGSGKKKAAIIGGSAAGGALLGKILNKDKAGAAVIGGAIGAAIAGGTKGKEAIIEPGEEMTVGLEAAVRLTIRR